MSVPVSSGGPGVGRRATAGVFWLTAQKWATRVLGFVTIAVLTRLLSPEDFGTVAAASTVLPFFFLFADLGFAAYIVQAKRVDQRMLSTAFWFSLGAGVALCLVMIALAPALGLLFRNNDVVPIIQALSIWVVLTAFGSVPMAILRRDMRFSVIALQGAGAAVVAQVIALILAFSGAGAWTLVVQSLVGPAIMSALAWMTTRWHPQRTFVRSDFFAMASFGGKVLVVEFVAMLRALGEAVVISATLGVGAFGYMTIAQRLVQVVQDMSGSAIVPVTQVAFAKIRDDAERLRSAYLRASRLTYFALALPLTIVAVAAPLIIPIIFGDGWEQSYQVAQILALTGIMSVSAWLDHGLFYGTGKPGVWLLYALIIDALTLGTTLALAHMGLVAIAFGFLGVCIVATVTRWFLTSRLLATRAGVVAGPFWFVAVVVIASGTAGWAVKEATAALPPFISLIFIGFAVLIVHLVATRVIAPQVLPEAASMLARSKAGARVPYLRRFA